MASETKVPMIGCLMPYGPKGRKCPCCAEAPGKGRTTLRRSRKRRERQLFKIQVNKEARENS